MCEVVSLFFSYLQRDVSLYQTVWLGTIIPVPVAVVLSISSSSYQPLPPPVLPAPHELLSQIVPAAV